MSSENVRTPLATQTAGGSVPATLEYVPAVGEREAAPAIGWCGSGPATASKNDQTREERKR